MYLCFIAYHLVSDNQSVCSSLGKRMISHALGIFFLAAYSSFCSVEDPWTFPTSSFSVVVILIFRQSDWGQVRQDWKFFSYLQCGISQRYSSGCRCLWDKTQMCFLYYCSVIQPMPCFIMPNLFPNRRCPYRLSVLPNSKSLLFYPIMKT